MDGQNKAVVFSLTFSSSYARKNTKIGLLVPFREEITVYYSKHMKPINTFFYQNVHC